MSCFSGFERSPDSGERETVSPNKEHWKVFPSFEEAVIAKSKMGI